MDIDLFNNKVIATGYIAPSIMVLMLLLFTPQLNAVLYDFSSTSDFGTNTLILTPQNPIDGESSSLMFFSTTLSENFLSFNQFEVGTLWNEGQDYSWSVILTSMFFGTGDMTLQSNNGPQVFTDAVGNLDAASGGMFHFTARNEMAVPEPATLLLLSTSAACALIAKRRRMAHSIASVKGPYPGKGAVSCDSW